VRTDLALLRQSAPQFAGESLFFESNTVLPRQGTQSGSAPLGGKSLPGATC
jgi:hypothetical protein